MKIVDRLILTLYSLVIALISLVLIIIPFNMFHIFNVNEGISLIESMKGNYFYSLIGLIFFIVSIRFLLSGIIGTKDTLKESFLVMKNEYGEVIIYSNTIVGLVQNIVDGFSGIKNINTSVNLFDGQIEVLMEADVLPEINIPEKTKELQQKVKEYLEDTTGAKVGEIKVEINNVSTPSRIIK